MTEEAEEFQEQEEGGEEREVFTPDAPEIDDQGDNEADRERARLSGWKPQDEANLPEGKWRSAKEFNEVGKRAPELLKENKLMFDKIQQLNDNVTKMAQNQFDMVAEARVDARSKVIAELELTKRNAVSEADEDAYDRADQAVKQELRKAQEEHQQATPQQPTVDPVFYQWQNQPGNEWYGTDTQKTAAADAYAQRIMGDPKYNGNTMLFYQDVGAYVERFNAAPAVPGASKTETGGRPTRRQAKKDKSFTDLGRDAKAAWESQKNMKVGGKLIFANKEEFATKYFATYGD